MEIKEKHAIANRMDAPLTSYLMGGNKNGNQKGSGLPGHVRR